MRLQRTHQKPLHEIDPDILHDELAFSTAAILPLAPTDSIIEALRCGVELGVPVFGVDMEESASLERKPCLTEDPISAGRDVAGWALRNARLVQDVRDEEIDFRREIVMVCRLKALLQRYNRVLFTGGLAHWLTISEALQDPKHPAATAIPDGNVNSWERVIVDPRLAIPLMDVFPPAVTAYEQNRFPAWRTSPTRREIDHEALLDGLLKRTYEISFATEGCSGRRHEDLAQVGVFEQLLSGLTVVNQQAVPDLMTLLECADSMMSCHFTSDLHKVFTEYDWVKPEDWGLPVIGPPETGSGATLVDIWAPARLSGGETVFTHRERIHASMGERRQGPAIFLQTPQSSRSGSIRRQAAESRVWPPDDNALTAATYMAAAAAGSREYVTEEFGGCLQDGIDMKAILRSASRGEERVFVRRNVESRDGGGGENATVVFILKRPLDTSHGGWRYLTVGDAYTRGFVRDPRRFDEITGELGSNFLGTVTIGVKGSIPSHMRPFVRGSHHILGVVHFGNPCLDMIQSARWLEKTNYRRSPVFRGNGFRSLLKTYQERFGLDVNLAEPEDALIRFAIPYARERVVVVAPDGFSVDPQVAREAKARRVDIKILPLTMFSSQMIGRIQTQRVVDCYDEAGLYYPEELETVFGESINTFLEHIPQDARADSELLKRKPQ
jgi:hypothetical protein